MSRPVLVSKLVPLALLGIVLVSNLTFAAETIYSGDAIPEHCAEQYEQGSEVYNFATERRLTKDERRDLYSDQLVSQPADCAFYFSMGIFDAQHHMLQKLTLLFGLELMVEADAENRPKVLKQIVVEFRERFELAGLEPATVDRMQTDPAFFAERLPMFIEKMRGFAREKRVAVPFGRFVFVQGLDSRPFTLFEYERDQDGGVRVAANGELVVRQGTYAIAAERLAKRTIGLVKEYLAWQPSVFFGEDAWWRGAFWRYFNPDRPSNRGVIEKGYFSAVRMLVQSARNLSLNLEPYLQMQLQMNRKQRAVLEHEIKLYERTRVAIMAAPLIPVGMAAGAAGLGYAGLASLPGGTASFTLSSASLWSAANTSALISGGVLAGFAGLGAYQGIRDQMNDDSPFRFSRMLDRVIGATVQSFPLAAIAPAVVGGGAAGVKYLSISIPAFVNNSFSLAKSLRSLGFRGSIKKIPHLSKQALKWWATTWWKNRRVLGFQYLAHQVTCFGFEVYSREFVLGDEHRLFPRDSNGDIQFFNWSGYHRQGLVTIGSSVIGGVLFQPAMYMRSMLGRALYGQTITVTSVMMSQQIMDGGVDFERVKFGLMYSFSYSRWRGEAVRPVYLSKFVTGHGGGRQTALTILMNVILGLAESPVKNYLMDEYMHHGITPVGKVREVAMDYYKIDISDFGDDEIQLAWHEFMNDEENQEFLSDFLASTETRTAKF